MANQFDVALPIDKAFPRFVTRRVKGLNGFWDFAFLGDVHPSDVAVDEIVFRERHPVPSAFDALPDHAGKRGLAAYRLNFHLPPNTTGLIEFEGVGFWAAVFIDGKSVGGIRHGWTPFEVSVPPEEEADRELVVLVDNRFDYLRSPLHEEFFDFHHWGGVTRPVWLHEIPHHFIRHVVVRAETVEVLEVSVECPESEHAQLHFELDGRPISPTQKATDHAGRFVATFTSLPLQIWSPDAPHLHHLRVSLPDDDWIARFGVRSVKVHDGALFLNGEPLRLFGVNRHESHPQFGSALPPTLLLGDLQLIRSLGANFVRGSHYPQDQKFLDLCDEMGVLVWEEGTGWGQREKQLTDPDFQNDHAAMLEAMLRRSINHPSVILWGFLNEAGTNHPSSRQIFEKSVKLIRETDPTRPLTYATMFPTEDLCYDLVDVISVNTYPGWYGCEDHPDPLALVVPRIREIAAHLDQAGCANKPFILSEIGVEALPGWHDAFRGFFTEEFQADYLETVGREFLTNPSLSGLVIWHFSDARTYRGGRSLMRPRAFNNKGIFDEYRRPKRSVEMLKQLFSNQP